MERTHWGRKAAARIALFLALVIVGLGVRAALAKMREAPHQAEVRETVLHVEVARVFPEDVPVVIRGFGEVRPLDVVDITPQVAGEIVALHGRLEAGEVIAAGELLFRIDPRDYRASKAQALAQTEQLESAVSLLKTQYGIDAERRQTYARNRDLAKEELARDARLYKEDVGTQAAADRSEMAYNQAHDALDQLEQSLQLYPIRIREAESRLAAAQAELEKAAIRLERTEVFALFDARVKRVELEVGEYVAPGTPVLTLANDAVLEISVSLDSRDARSWLEFEDSQEASAQQWFGALKPVACRIAWTEDPDNHWWTGRLNRVERFDETTRTVTVAVRVAADEARSPGRGLPLVEGMFCSVAIPGRAMRQVYRLPRWAVSFEGQVFMAEANRLKRRQVKVLRNQGEEVFISQGLNAGELVITTRLVNPLPNSLLSFTVEGPVSASSGPPSVEPGAAEGAP